MKAYFINWGFQGEEKEEGLFTYHLLFHPSTFHATKLLLS